MIIALLPFEPTRHVDFNSTTSPASNALGGKAIAHAPAAMWSLAGLCITPDTSMVGGGGCDAMWSAYATCGFDTTSDASMVGDKLPGTTT